LRRRLTQASLLPSFVGRSLSFEIQHAKIVKPGPFERDRVFAIWYSADRTRRSPGPHPRAVVSLVRGRSSPRQPPSDPPPPTSPLSTTMTMSVVRNDRLWHRLSGVSVLGRDARDGLGTMPPPPPPHPGHCILVLVVRRPSLYRAARCLRHQVRRICSSNPRHGVKGNSGRRVGSDDERSSVEPQY
jgi:hypothetical protein